MALSASLLTAVPLTPAGIGFVEGGVVGLLTIVYGVSTSDALAITLVDRSISVLSIIILGSIAYAISPKRRGLGVQSAAPARRPPDQQLGRARSRHRVAIWRFTPVRTGDMVLTGPIG